MNLFGYLSAVQGLINENKMNNCRHMNHCGRRALPRGPKRQFLLFRSMGEILTVSSSLEAEQPQLVIAELKAHIKRQDTQLAARDEEIRLLKEENAQLKREVAELKLLVARLEARLAELEPLA